MNQDKKRGPLQRILSFFVLLSFSTQLMAAQVSSQSSLAQGLLSKEFLESSKKLAYTQQVQRLHSIDNLFDSMSGFPSTSTRFKDLAKLMNVDSTRLTQFLDRNPSFKYQFNELLLMLVLNTGASSSGIEANEKTIENLIEHLKDWNDRNKNDKELHADLEKIRDFLEREKEFLSAAPFYDDSEKLVAFTNTDTYLDVPTVPFQSSGQNFSSAPLLDSNGNAILISKADQKGKQKNSDESKEEEAVSEDTSNDSTPVPSVNSSPERIFSSSPAVPRRPTQKDIRESIETSRFSSGALHHFPQSSANQYSPLSDPDDFFRQSIRAPSSGESDSDFCRRFGIGCGDSGLSRMTQTQNALATNLALEQQRQMIANLLATTTSETKSPSRRSLDPDIGPFMEEEKDNLDPKKKKRVRSKTTETAKSSETEKAEATKAKEEKKNETPSQTTDNKKPEPKQPIETPLASNKAKAPQVATGVSEISTPNAPKVPDAPPTPLMAEKPKQEFHQASPPAPELIPEATAAPRETPKYARTVSDLQDEEEARKTIQSIFANHKTAHLTPSESASKWQRFYEERTQTVVEQNPILKSIMERQKQSHAGKPLPEKILGTLYLTSLITSSDSPAFSLLQKTNVQREELDPKKCFNFSTFSQDPETAAAIKGYLAYALDTLSGTLAGEHSADLKQALSKQCSNLGSNLSKSLCLINKVFNNPQIDRALFGGFRLGKTILMKQIQDCQGPGEIGEWIVNREREIRSLARSCGSWESRVVTGLAKNRSEAKVTEVVDSNNIRKFVEANFMDFLSPLEKEKMNLLGSKTLPIMSNELKSLRMIDTPHNAVVRDQQSFPIGAFKIYTMHVLKELETLANSPHSSFATRVELENVRANLNKAIQTSNKEAQREITAQFCDKYINPRYTFLLGSVLSAKGLDIVGSKYKLPNGEMFPPDDNYTPPLKWMADQDLERKDAPPDNHQQKTFTPSSDENVNIMIRRPASSAL